MSTKITIDNTQGRITSEGSAITPQYYDISGEVAGTPNASTRVFNFKTARAFTLKSGLSVAGCVGQPTATTTFTIKKGDTSIGTIQFDNGSFAGTVTISSDVSVAAGDIINVNSPVDVKSIDTPFWTLVGIIPS